MKNKLGVNEHILQEVQRKVINQKLNLLDETFTFNQSNFNFKYLICLNEFLFKEYYYYDNLDNDMGLRRLDFSEIKTIENYLEKIVLLCVNNPEDLESILNLIDEIWRLQPFVVGNTRTLVGFLKILSKSFLLNIDVDVNKVIERGSNSFKLNNIVNLKGLTK